MLFVYKYKIKNVIVSTDTNSQGIFYDKREQGITLFKSPKLFHSILISLFLSYIHFCAVDQLSNPFWIINAVTDFHWFYPFNWTVCIYVYTHIHTFPYVYFILSVDLLVVYTHSNSAAFVFLNCHFSHSP